MNHQDLSLYRIFHIVANHGNISKAAKELYVSQPAISKSIKSLEEQSSMLAYILTVNEITSKTAFLKSLLIFLFEVIIVVLINIVYIVGKIKKK